MKNVADPIIYAFLKWWFFPDVRHLHSPCLLVKIFKNYQLQDFPWKPGTLAYDEGPMKRLKREDRVARWKERKPLLDEDPDE